MNLRAPAAALIANNNNYRVRARRGDPARLPWLWCTSKGLEDHLIFNSCFICDSYVLFDVSIDSDTLLPPGVCTNVACHLTAYEQSIS